MKVQSGCESVQFAAAGGVCNLGGGGGQISDYEATSAFMISFA